MSKNKKPVDDTHLSDAIRSLQNLLDDVSTRPFVAEESAASTTATTENSVENKFEETVEFDQEATSTFIPVATDNASAIDIDSHFDMNIPPALPDDEDEEEHEEMDDMIPTLSETIVGGDIPVLNEIVQLPDGKTIPEPDPNMTLEMSIQAGGLPTPVSDAAEAATDAVQIMLARYRVKPLTPEVREQLMSAVTEILINSPELEIPDSIV
jgi:hypothetical protein